MYITHSKSSHTTAADDPASRQRRMHSSANSRAGSRAGVKVHGAANDENVAANTRKALEVQALPAGKTAANTTIPGKQISSTRYFESARLMDVSSAASLSLYSGAGYSDQSGVRGSLVDDGHISRRGQDAVATYSENQLLEERYHYAQVMGIDEYA